MNNPGWARACAVGSEISLRVEGERTGRAHPVEVFTGPFIHKGHTFAVRGRGAPVAEVRCSGPAPILVPVARLLWRERGLTIIPHDHPPLLECSGSGHFACAASTPGCVFMLYLPAGECIEVVKDRWLCAAGLHDEPVWGNTDLQLDRFQADDGDGLLLLHGVGNAYEVMLERGESLQIVHWALLYKERGLQVQRVPGAGGALLRCGGPGLIAVQTGGGWG
jgi:hypothetical protein